MFGIFKILRLTRGFLVLSREKDLIPENLVRSLPAPIKIFLKVIPSNKKSDLSESLQKLGPTWIKMGQFLSTRPDIIGNKLSIHLRGLQDSLPPFDKKHVEQAFIESFGEDYKKKFKKIDEPIAAASIAQVHKAIIKSDGKSQTVAVKILRPNIEGKIKKDLNDFYLAAKILEKFSSEARRLRVLEVVKTLEESLSMEVDLRLEAAAQSEIIDNTKNDDFIEIPKIFWDLTSKNILTTQWVNSHSSKDLIKIKKKNINFNSVGENIMKTFLILAIRDGFFHADMHQGNLFVKNDATIIPVDFGIMGRLNIDSRRYLLEILSGFVKKDYKKISDIHFEAGYIPENQDRDKFAQALRAIGEPIQGQDSKSISMGHLLSQLLEVTGQFAMRTQPQLLLLQKTMVVTEGVAREFNPDLNIWSLSEPILDNLSNIKSFDPSKISFKKESINSNAREIFNSIINDLEKTKKDFNKIKKAFGDDGLKIDKKTLMLITERDNLQSNLLRPLIVILLILIVSILLINK
ncbi:AarF/UbiB family protein [Hyphomicrobiales bacterium]|nr:AarF/UbiB family protein [Hyphomicrobiales bacterium]